MGIGNAVNTGFANNGIRRSCPTMAREPAWDSSLPYLIGIAVAFFGAAILTYLVGFEEVPAEDAGYAAPAPEVKKISASVKEEEADVKVAAPVEGKAYPLNEVKDEVFASEALGKGIAVLFLKRRGCGAGRWNSDRFISHAACYGIKVDSGVELLIHVGMDTVEMNGADLPDICRRRGKSEEGR